MREGFEKQIRVRVGSADKMMTGHPLSKPILAARKTSFPIEKIAVSTINMPAAKQNIPNVSGAGNLNSMITGSEKTKTASLAIDSVLIEPIPVQAGKYFEVIIDLVLSDPTSSRQSLPVTMDYSVSKDGKVLKRFKSKAFTVPNGEYYTLIRKPKASIRKGSYELLIELGYKENKARKTVKFDIE
jgi:hypothetical protein